MAYYMPQHRDGLSCRFHDFAVYRSESFMYTPVDMLRCRDCGSVSERHGGNCKHVWKRKFWWNCC